MRRKRTQAGALLPQNADLIDVPEWFRSTRDVRWFLLWDNHDAIDADQCLHKSWFLWQVCAYLSWETTPTGLLMELLICTECFLPTLHNTLHLWEWGNSMCLYFTAEQRWRDVHNHLPSRARHTTTSRITNSNVWLWTGCHECYWCNFPTVWNNWLFLPLQANNLQASSRKGAKVAISWRWEHLTSCQDSGIISICPIGGCHWHLWRNNGVGWIPRRPDWAVWLLWGNLYWSQASEGMLRA